MFKVATVVKESSIDGIGVFAAEFIPEGTITWVYDEEKDLYISKNDYILLLSEKTRKYFDKYAYSDKYGNFYLCGDNAKFENHSDTPNQYYNSFTKTDIAAVDIEVGQELTVDYFCFDWVTRKTGQI